MGNTNTGLSLTGRGTDLGHTGMKGQPMYFHTTHSLNVQLSANRKIARRIESFCKGIAFGDRPVSVNERVYINFAKVSTSWSGVLRFGFTAHDPATLNAADLPRYACPDLTNKPGYWAKALPERYAEQENILHYYVTRSGDVFYGINNEEKGLFFGGVNTSVKLWPIIDIYGNTTAMEFVDGGSQLNNIQPTPVLTPSRTIEQDANHSLSPLSFARTAAPPPPPNSVTHTPQHQTGRQVTSHPAGLTAEAHAQMASQLPLGLPTVRHYANLQFSPIHFHQTVGRHVVVSADRTIAVRLSQEYCSGYVFTHRPLRLGEKLVIQILSVDNAFVGGLAFGMTACDPATVRQDQLPDDSDMLLDRPEYWVVNKDVRAQPEIGDELSFHLTLEGEVRYGKNGKFITTLMHVDKSLPMWAFFDVYGNTQKIRCLGTCSTQRASGAQISLVGANSQQNTGLTVALPPRNQSSPTSMTSSTAPPRPPPPRPTGRNSPIPPTLPPKQNRHHPPPPLPAPLIPLPTLARSQPQIPPRPTPSPAPSIDEAAENACNECSVCLDEPAGCVLYTCGHICMCYACAIGIKDSGDGLCPICRREIKDVIKIFRS